MSKLNLVYFYSELRALSRTISAILVNLSTNRQYIDLAELRYYGTL